MLCESFIPLTIAGFTDNPNTAVLLAIVGLPPVSLTELNSATYSFRPAIAARTTNDVYIIRKSMPADRRRIPPRTMRSTLLELLPAHVTIVARNGTHFGPCRPERFASRHD